ncbi:MAG: PAS domain S-box protein, partial [Lachnospiraceae bacterium]|nr:PAS domain S-box protein [Lachnospiraceae bacterium]
MYTCRLHIYFAGHPSHALDVIKRMPALENFTHIFSESDEAEASLSQKADVIIADLSNTDMQPALQTFVQNCSAGTRIILLASREQMRHLCSDPALKDITDIWIMPMSDEELRFRFLRWQQTFKMNKDFWETSHFLEATINNVPNLIWYKDKDGVHEKVNNSFCQAVNKTKQQVEGRRHAYIWDVEEDDPSCIESEHQVMSKEQTLVSEETIKAGEETRTLMCYKSPLYNCDGTVMGTVGVGVDVTQERAYEQQIINKNRTLETILATIDCGLMNHRLNDSHILNINRAALKLLGYETLEELTADGFDLIAASVVDEDRELLRNSIRTLKKAGDTVNVAYRVQHKNGEILHIMGNIKLYEENGELLCQRFLVDVTEQKLQERKDKKRQMELLQALSLDFTQVCFLEPDTGMLVPVRTDKGKLDNIFENKISLEKSMEHYIEEWVYEEDREMLRHATSLDTIQSELRNRQIYSVNYRKRQDGELIYFQIKAVSVGTEDGGLGIVLGFRSVDADIRKEMEQNTLLEAALAQANRASKAKSVFLSNMSHDIRTPMNAIVGFTNLAITHIDRKEQVVEYLKKIQTSGNHLLSLINDILDMSHIESGKLQLDEKLCSLPEILHGLRNILQADIHAKQLDLQIDTVDVVDEAIYCDKLRLNQVLLNLLSNAVKYTGAGGHVSMRITEKPGAPAGYANYEFSIKDSGIGMSQEFVEHIFEPFERERNSTISKIQGTGLGMAITKNIVDMMNGSISVTSEQGVGSEFKVSFTFRLHAERKEDLILPELKGCKALVVDDDFNTCDSVSYMLGQLGLHAEWTLSGKEAVLRSHQALTRGASYSVYIVDWL